MPRDGLRALAAGALTFAASCGPTRHWLEGVVPLVEAMNVQVAEAHGAAPLDRVALAPLYGPPPVMARASAPGLIQVSPWAAKLPRGLLLWVVTHELVHLYGRAVHSPRPLGDFATLVEEARAELVVGELLPRLEPAARVLRPGRVRWLVDAARAAPRSCGQAVAGSPGSPAGSVTARASWRTRSSSFR